MRRWWAEASLVLVVIVCALPGLDRAVYIDEHIFLRIAGNVASHPLFPQEISGVFFGTPVPNFAAHTHPPVGEYALALLLALFGPDREWALRAGFLLFSIVAVLAFYRLAWRWSPHPFELSLLFALSPAFVVMAPTLMMDTPMLAFLLAGIAFYFDYLDGRRRRGIAAGLLFVAAAGTGYTALVPLFCLGVSVVLWRRPFRDWLPILAAPAALGLWLLAMSVHFGFFPVTAILGYYQGQRSVVRTLLATVTFVGGVTVFPLAALWLRRNGRAAVVSAVSAAAVAALIVPRMETTYRLWFGFLFAAGLLLLLGFFVSARGILKSGVDRGEAFLMLWAPGTLAFFVFFADMVNARYVLLALPPLLLIVLRHAGRNAILATAGATAALSIAVSVADVQFVNSYRTWADAAIPRLQSEGFELWSGAESGLRYCLEKKGLVPLLATDLRPRAGDLIVRQAGLFRYGLSSEVEPMLIPLRSWTLGSGLPLRTFNIEAGAGFHDSRFGWVPYAFSRAPFDTVDIAQISPLSRPFPQPPPESAVRPVWTPEGPQLTQADAELEFSVRVPATARIEYDVDGPGRVERFESGFRLMNESAAPIIWRRFRFVPNWF